MRINGLIITWLSIITSFLTNVFFFLMVFKTFKAVILYFNGNSIWNIYIKIYARNFRMQKLIYFLMPHSFTHLKHFDALFYNSTTSTMALLYMWHSFSKFTHAESIKCAFFYGQQRVFSHSHNHLAIINHIATKFEIKITV